MKSERSGPDSTSSSLDLALANVVVVEVSSWCSADVDAGRRPVRRPRGVFGARESIVEASSSSQGEAIRGTGFSVRPTLSPEGISRQLGTNAKQDVQLSRCDADRPGADFFRNHNLTQDLTCSEIVIASILRVVASFDNDHQAIAALVL